MTQVDTIARLRAQLDAAYDALTTVRALLAQGQPSAARLLLDDAVRGVKAMTHDDDTPTGTDCPDHGPASGDDCPKCD